jgi:hypothetical protein
MFRNSALNADDSTLLILPFYVIYLYINPSLIMQIGEMLMIIFVSYTSQAYDRLIDYG